MASKTGKFDAIFESCMQRYERGGFLVGDCFEFVPKFKSTPEYKALGDSVKAMLDEMIETGLNIHVINIKDTASHGATLHPTLSIAVDTGGKRYSTYVDIPDVLGQPIDYGHNLPPIPDAMVRDNNITLKPEEAEEDKENLSNKTDKGDGKLSNTERTLASKNTKIPSKAATPTPAATYTQNYMT